MWIITDKLAMFLEEKIESKMRRPNVSGDDLLEETDIFDFFWIIHNCIEDFFSPDN